MISLQSSRIIKQKQNFAWNTNGDPEKLDRILNPLVRSAADLLVSAERKRVKKRSDPACGWLFLDFRRNLGRRWCDMRNCVNRAKASRFYKKRKASNRAHLLRRRYLLHPGRIPI